VKKEVSPSQHDTPLREKIREQLDRHCFFSNRRIAATVGTSHVTVAKVRAESRQWSRSQIRGRDGILRRIPSRATLDKEIDRVMGEATRLFDKAELPEFRQYKKRLIYWLQVINTQAANWL
jgi:hypothetical protein